METQNPNPQQQPQEDNNKVQKQFDDSIKKLVAILGDESKLNPQKKLPKDDVAMIVQQLFEEDTTQLREDLKGKIKALLQKHVEFKRALFEKERELAKLKTDKQKEFNQEAQKLFGSIENIGQIQSEYYSSLSEAASAEVPSEE